MALEPVRLIIVSRQRDIKPVAGPRPGRFRWLAGVNRLGARLAARVDRQIGGVQVHCDHVREVFEQAGHEVIVVTPFDAPWLLPVLGAGTTRLLRPLGPGVYERWRRIWHAWLIGLELRRQSSRFLAPGPPVVFYAQCALTADAALRWRRPGTRVALGMHSAVNEADELWERGLCEPGSFLYSSLVDFDQEIIPRVDGIVLVSRWRQVELYRTLPMTRRMPCAVYPNFLPDDWSSDPADRPPPTRDLVSVGRLVVEKNHRFVLDVLAAAAELGYRYTLTVVGDGPERTALEAHARELGMERQVVFAGERRDVGALLEAHRVYVHASVIEAFGIVLIEAMAKGLPVVAAPVGGIPEVFDDGVEGRYVSLDSAGDAAKVLVDLMGDEDALERASRAAYERFRAQFGASVVGPQIEAFLTSLVAGHA
ncbi:MAG: glycosyltransferase family 4 protein [Acidimicrobiia bacterium]